VVRETVEFRGTFGTTTLAIRPMTRTLPAPRLVSKNKYDVPGINLYNSFQTFSELSPGLIILPETESDTEILSLMKDPIKTPTSNTPLKMI